MIASNKWLSPTCPTVNEFSVDESKTEYHIQYFNTKSGVTNLNTDWREVKSSAEKLKTGIQEIKGL